MTDRLKTAVGLLAITRGPGNNVWMVATSWIDKMAQCIVRQFQPLRVILFGSHARGTPDTDSDVDFLVVLPGVPDKRKSAVEIRRALAHFPVPKDIIVTCPNEIAARSDMVGSILRPALREGKVLYERGGQDQ